MRKKLLALLLVATPALMAGCGSDAITGEDLPNAAPDTQVEATPPNLQATSFRIELFWSGSDPDGDVVGYEWIITSNGANNVLAPEDTSVTWNYTEVSDSTFVVSADIPEFEPDLDDDDITDPLDLRYWQTHTFLVRSIDDGGRKDPTPANVSFTATTLAPTIEIDFPDGPRVPYCITAPLAPAFGWTADDPDNPEGPVKEIRYTLQQLPAELPRQEFDRTNPIARLPESEWSEWIDYEAGSDSGRVKRYPILDADPGTPYLFAVQARDVAGAVTPTFVWNENVRCFTIGTSTFPLLNVALEDFQAESVTGPNNVKRLDLVAGQSLEFSWDAEAEAYGGIIEEFRYGFNVLDPNDPTDPNWAGPWGDYSSASRPTGFAEGTPNFVLQVRDNSGAITRIVYQFQVIQIKPRREQRPLLLVYDAEFFASDGPAIATWTDILSRVQGFSAEFDIVDARSPQGTELDFARVNDYRGVLWITQGDQSSFTVANLGPDSAGERFNFLEVYQRESGNILLAGSRPALVFGKYVGVGAPIINSPLLLDYDQRPPSGLGQVTIDGDQVNRGTLRWPYSGWCLESIDLVDPQGPISGERPGVIKRNLTCDAITYAIVDPDFVAEYSPAPQQVSNLYPGQFRITLDRSLSSLDAQLGGLGTDEFYNENTGVEPVAVAANVRDCQIPMFTAVARMDVDNPDVMRPVDVPEVYRLELQESLTNDRACPAFRVENREESRVSGSAIAIASTQYIETKQNRGLRQEDYLWGFNPLTYDLNQVRATLDWILLTQWGLND